MWFKKVIEEPKHNTISKQISGHFWRVSLSDHGSLSATVNNALIEALIDIGGRNDDTIYKFEKRRLEELFMKIRLEELFMKIREADVDVFLIKRQTWGIIRIDNAATRDIDIWKGVTRNLTNHGNLKTLIRNLKLKKMKLC